MKKIVFVGPGGLGGPMAALLARQGECEVSVLSRPGAHLDTIREQGLRVDGKAEFTIQLDAQDDAEKIGACDFLVFAVKGQHSAEAIERAKGIEVREAVLSVQNGVTKDDLLAEVFGRDKVIGAVSAMAGERPEPGRVTWTDDCGTLFGELGGGGSERIDSLVALFQRAGIDAERCDMILSATWAKTTGWVPLGLIATLSKCKSGTIFSSPTLAAGIVTMVRELGTLAEAKGIPLIDMGAYWVKTWCQGPFADAVERVRSSPLARTASTHSGLQEIRKGNRTEFGACIGPIVEEAEQRGVAMPAVQVMYSTLMALEKRQ